jgi:energy-converting hydrogenase Eha subunit G
MNYTNVVAINTIFLSVKVFDYMNKSKHMNMLSNTLYSSKEDTFYFLIIFTIFLFGFVGMAFISFGAYLSDYNSIANSIRKCFEITIGDFKYHDIEEVNAPMAVIFFFPFNVLFVFILTNIFLAIINDAYEEN